MFKLKDHKANMSSMVIVLVTVENVLPFTIDQYLNDFLFLLPMVSQSNN